jgi:hypothetical protein
LGENGPLARGVGQFWGLCSSSCASINASGNS